MITIDDYRTETAKLVDQIRDAIISGEFPMGTRLPQRFLAERFNTTTTVVRESLRTIESEGLIHIIPRFGAVVDKITHNNLLGRYLVREALEGMAARVANGKVTLEAGNKLKELATECDNKLPFDGISTVEKSQIHLNLHSYIAELTEIPELINPLRNIYLSSMIIANAHSVNWKEEFPNWHRQLVDAIIEGTPDEAEAMMRKHVRRGYEMEKSKLHSTSLLQKTLLS